MSCHLLQANGLNIMVDCGPICQGSCRVRSFLGGINSYTRYDGIRELRVAIAEKHKRFTGQVVDPENEIIVSAGSTGALYCACLALLKPGDEVIVFEPFYGYHISTLIATQALPVYVKMEPPDWKFSHHFRAFKDL